MTGERDETSFLEQSEASIATFFLTQLRAQDDSSWRQFVHIYGPLIRTWLRSSRLDEVDMADLEQETLRSVWEHIARFQKDGEAGSFRRWLWTVVQNKIRDFHRRSRRQLASSEGGTAAWMRINQTAAPADASEIVSVGTPSEIAGVIQRAIEMVQGEVKPHTWEAFWLLTVEELTAEEVAERQQRKVGSVYTAKSRVLSRLRAVLGEDAEHWVSTLGRFS